MAGRFGGCSLIGDRISVADLALVPQLYNARRYGLSLSGYPRLVAYEYAVLAQPWAAGHSPDQQPDRI